MATAIEALIASSAVDGARMLGIGIAPPGLVNTDDGIVLNPPMMPNWQRVPLRRALAEATGFPVLLEKDATAAVVAELWFAEPGASRDFAFMYYGTGLPPTSLDAADAVDSAFRRLAALASSGDPRATAILTDAARAIVVIVNLLDIDQVIFGGPFWPPIAPTVLAALPAAVRDDPVLVLPHPIRFAESAVPVDVAAVGAATLVLDNTFSPRPSALLLAAD